MITFDELLFTVSADNNKIRRRLPIKMISGISKKLKEDSKSLVIHAYQEADEFFHTDDRDDIISILKKLYYQTCHKNLLVFSPAESSLGDYCTTEEEAKKGLTRMPKKSTALDSENLYIDSSSDTEREDTKEEVRVLP